ncbi:proline dehydrogenase family protein [Dyadobacter subterraneus]|uniref:Proline dehydrogenase family protein n=1 Tax=Dyadobacter subterraneus TaxID=2773304 RepID=A0ABR9WIH4_9BACT|nr:proline dehydrogenase family protein [Dyadobacter subterraneus]MBE9465311.1 proline dehydrogenase family protein [Dyadobacter subterraneus]
MAYASQKDQIPVFFEDTSIAFASKSDSQLRKTYWLFSLMNQARVVNLGTFFIKIALKLHLPIKNLIRYTIFEQFCGGETISDCQQTISTLANSGVGTILDYSVEGEDNENSFDATAAEILRTIQKASESTDIPFSVFKITGIASTELLEKVQRKEILSENETAAYERVKQRVEKLCALANKLNVRIFVDAEESWVQNVIDDLTYEMMEKYNKEKAIVYNTYQFYRHETLQALKSAYLVARQKGYVLGGKLVRGAYMEKERMRAREQEYFNPIHTSKEATDKDYNAAIDFCLENVEHISICLGTHNEYSSQYCTCKMKKLGIKNDDQRIYFAQLLGMSDNISYNLAKVGYNVAKYVPYGPIDAVLPYLIRRAEENTSIAGQSSREYLLVKSEMHRRGVSSF